MNRNNKSNDSNRHNSEFSMRDKVFASGLLFLFFSVGLYANCKAIPLIKNQREKDIKQQVEVEGTKDAVDIIQDSKEEIRKISPVYYSQLDSKWANTEYSTDAWKNNNRGNLQTIASSGCGVTTAAMVASTMTGKDLTPDIIADYSVKHGYRTYNSGTSEEIFEGIARDFGFKCTNTKDINQVITALKSKKNCTAVALMQYGNFTGRNGHFLFLTGVVNENGVERFVIYDCNNCEDYCNPHYGDGVVTLTGDIGIVKADTDVIRRENFKSVGYYIFDI